MRLDHRAGTLRFGAPGLESDRMREHIAQLARRLSTAQRMIQPAANPAVDQRRVAVSCPPRQHVHGPCAVDDWAARAVAYLASGW